MFPKTIFKSPLIPFCILVLLLVSCKNPQKENPEVIVTEEKTEYLCFLNEYTFPDSDKNIDVLELNLAITGTTVSGHYNWLPALKDQRKGKLDGTINGKIIHATYTYMQEGIETTAPITINLQDDKAIIKGDDPTSGLDTEVIKITCAK